MKIAIPTRGNSIDDHFGHCELYTIVTLDENKNVVQTDKLPSPQGCGCKSDIAAVLHGMGVSVMLAGNMGAGAYNVLTNHGITVYRGCTGEIKSVISDFTEGLIADSNVTCHSHEQHQGSGHDHVCNH
jgi:predicted Fe-Mo cluster-binding NifX family protein